MQDDEDITPEIAELDMFTSFLNSLDHTLVDALRFYPNLTNNTVMDTLIGNHDFGESFTVKEYQDAITQFTIANTGTLRSDITSIDKDICNIMLGHYYQTACERWPTNEEIVDIILSQPCRCTFNFGDQELKTMLLFYISTEGILPSCFEVENIFVYKAQMNRFPNYDELIDFIQRVTAFGNDPEEYHLKDKVHVPASNTTELPVLYLSSPETCTLCQEECSTSQLVVKLEPCGHVFHATAEDCLETKSIYQWLEEHNYCFLCKTKVEANPNSN